MSNNNVTLPHLSPEMLQFLLQVADPRIRQQLVGAYTMPANSPGANVQNLQEMSPGADYSAIQGPPSPIGPEFYQAMMAAKQGPAGAPGADQMGPPTAMAGNMTVPGVDIPIQGAPMEIAGVTAPVQQHQHTHTITLDPLLIDLLHRGTKTASAE